MGAALSTLSLVGSIALPLGSGFAIGLGTRHDVNGWYKDTKRPKWTPPNWVFGPAWSLLYTSMGVASWLVWKQGKGINTPLALYAAQLALNLAWTPLFFKSHKLDLALVDSVAMLGVASAATVKMAEVVPEAQYLMAPYLAWVTFATALNGEILRLNPEKTAIKPRKIKQKIFRGAKNAQKKAKDAGSAAASKTKEAAASVKEAVGGHRGADVSIASTPAPAGR
eukprot:GHRR01000848.1.p1 GENE.GHRR01000848.1~~GHRR01000848.1.p1  ORF type:complete len:224 (+),score=75.52 GHRR01000848.1:684-1355(+)